MTRKHFIAIAATIKAEPDPVYREHTARLLAKEFAVLNPRFDLSKFLKACGV